MKLYHEGKDSYSSWCGGLFTILVYLIIADLLISALWDIFTRNTYVVKETGNQLLESNLMNLTYHELQKLDIKLPIIEFTPLIEENIT
jgi:hypothetical protein